MMVGRLSPMASQRGESSRVRGSNLTVRVAMSDRRGNRRRSADSYRARPQVYEEVYR